MAIIKGKHAVLEALHSESEIERIVLSFQTQNQPDMRMIMHLAKSRRIKVQIASKETFDRMIPDAHTQGVLAYMPEHEGKSLEEILENQAQYPFVVMVDHLQDPYNFGAILRTCETMGIKAVIYPKDRNVQITPGVIKTSSGAIHYLDLVKVTNLAQCLEKMEKAGYWIYGTSDRDSTDLDHFTPQFPMVLVLGNEEKGLSPLLAKKTHGMIQIPMKGKISSLNVSVAAGILMYTLSRKLDFL